ncbi:hypothetical protein BJY04DRAFT_220795 [Aspergillus karnatakaensis]|uniref:uncharacterized protein n=1 Tax=Aspergillus karnatakaensis TaxID=1810916 RepID=UPI003CCD929F
MSSTTTVPLHTLPPSQPQQQQNQQSPQKQPLQPTLEGYDTLAALMTSDKGLSIFRSFKRLNAKNLLYLQAEIAVKEKELNEIILRDQEVERKELELTKSQNGGHTNGFLSGKMSCSVRMLKEGIEQEQWAKWLEVRELLERYNNTLTSQANLLRLKPPHSRDLKIFRSWLKRNAFCCMAVERNQWFGANDEHTGDLVTLSGRYENVDSLTRWVFRVAIPVWHRLLGGERGGCGKQAGDLETGTGTRYYDDEKIIRATRVTSIITSSVIPASSMLVLYLVDDMVSRLVIIIFYNIIFSIVIGLLAKARRVEVFAASTAFAAVQVAFITNFPRD